MSIVKGEQSRVQLVLLIRDHLTIKDHKIRHGSINQIQNCTQFQNRFYVNSNCGTDVLTKKIIGSENSQCYYLMPCIKI